MDVAASRFADSIGPHCPARDCDTQVIECVGVAAFFDATPDNAGKYQLTDTGGTRPHARLLQVGQQFGKVGTLHRRHEVYCVKAKRIKKR